MSEHMTEEENDYEYELRKYEYELLKDKRLADYRMFINETRRETTSNLSKAVLTFSSGSIALSIAFLDKLKDLKFSLLLSCSWALFSCAVIIMIISYITGSKSLTEQEENAEKFYKDTEQEPEYWTPITTNLLNISVICFGLALFFLMSFLVVNTI